MRNCLRQKKRMAGRGRKVAEANGLTELSEQKHGGGTVLNLLFHLILLQFFYWFLPRQLQLLSSRQPTKRGKGLHPSDLCRCGAGIEAYEYDYVQPIWR